jgi:phosphoadenosine phosphosulfate reductase
MFFYKRLLMISNEKINALNDHAKGLTPQQILRFAFNEFGKRLTFASSFGEEDQVILHMISLEAPEIKIFTLDTGRLFPQTYELIASVEKRYGRSIEIYFPDANAVEKMIHDKANFL